METKYNSYMMLLYEYTEKRHTKDIQNKRINQNAVNRSVQLTKKDIAKLASKRISTNCSHYIPYAQAISWNIRTTAVTLCVFGA